MTQSIPRRLPVELSEGPATVVKIKDGDTWKEVQMDLDTWAMINVISQAFVMELGLEKLENADLLTPEWIQGTRAFVYGAYRVHL